MVVTPEWEESWSRFVRDELKLATMGCGRSYDGWRWLAVLDATAGVTEPIEALERLTTNELLPPDWLTPGGRSFHVPADPVALRRAGLIDVQVTPGGSHVRFRIGGVDAVLPLLQQLLNVKVNNTEGTSWDVPVAQVEAQYRALAPSDPIRLIAGGYQPGGDWPVELTVRDGGLWPARPSHDVALPDTLRDARTWALWAPEMATAEALVLELRVAMGLKPEAPRWFLANPAMFVPQVAVPTPREDTLTSNGRVYPRSLVEREMERFQRESYVASDAQRQLDRDILGDLEAAMLLPIVPLQMSVSEVGPDGRYYMAHDTSEGALWGIHNTRDVLRQMSRGRRSRQGPERFRRDSLAKPGYERMLRALTALRVLGVDYHPVANLLSINPEGHPV